MDDEVMVLAGANDNTDDNMILPFELQDSRLRGRIVRLGGVIDDILVPHHYPPAVAGLVAEAAALTLLLAGMLKFDGTFTLQAQGSGPVRMLVADLTTAGDLRALATFDPDHIAALTDGVTGLRAGDRPHDLAQLMGTGHLAFTVDQGDHTDRYQGIVQLVGADLATCVGHYFSQSEQIDTVLRVAAARSPDGGMRAGGLMIQRLPLPHDLDPLAIDQADDHWARAEAVMGTCTAAELTDSFLPATDLLFRLFHEDGVRVFNPLAVRKGCRCNAEKLAGVLKTMSTDDLAHMTVDGQITMTCEFCNKDFGFTPESLA